MSSRATMVLLAVLLTAGCGHATPDSRPTTQQSVPHPLNSGTTQPSVPAANLAALLHRAETDDSSGYWLRHGIHITGEGIGANVLFVDVVPEDWTAAHVAEIKARYGDTVEVDPVPYAVPA